MAMETPGIVTGTRVGDGARERPAPPQPLAAALWQRSGRVLITAANVGGFLALWQWAVATRRISELFVPRPTDIVAATIEMALNGQLWVHLGFSAQNFLIGFALSVAVGVPIGLAMGASKWIDTLLGPYVWSLYSAPRIALQPLFILWLGFTVESKVLLIFLSGVMPVLISSMAGVKTVDHSLIKAARVFGASRRQLYSRVILPFTVPFVMNGIRLGISRALVGLIVSEMFGSGKGMGYVIARRPADGCAGDVLDADDPGRGVGGARRPDELDRTAGRALAPGSPGLARPATSERLARGGLMKPTIRGPRPVLSRRRFLALLGAGSAVGLAAACSQAPAAQPTPTSAPKPAAQATTPPQPAAQPTAAPAATKPAAATLARPEMASFTYGMNNPNYLTQIVHFVALEKGYFKEVGFENIEVITGDEYLTGTVGGSLLLSQGDTDVAFAAYAKGEPIIWLACYRPKEYRILGVAKGINSAADLKGKQMSGGPPGSRNEYIMKNIVRRLGLDPEKDVEWVPVRGASDGRLQALVAGQIAGASIFPRHEKALLDAGGKILVKDFVDMPQEGMFAKAETVQKYPNLIVAYLAATLRARQWLVKDKETVARNKAEAIAIMEKHGFTVSEDFRALYETEMYQSPDGGFAPASMDQLVEESVAVGSLPKGFDWRKAVNLSLLHKAQAAVGLPENPKI